MEIVYRTGTVKVHKTCVGSFTIMQVVAVGYLDGCTIFFGGFYGKVTCAFEEVTGIRCCDYKSFPDRYSVEQCVEGIVEDIYYNIRKSGLSFHEVRDRWLYCHQQKIRLTDYNFIPLWHISLLIG